MSKRRWLLLALLAPVYVAGLVVASAFLLVLILREWEGEGYFSLVMNLLGDSDWWSVMGLAGLVAVGIQVLFLIPMFKGQPPRGERSKSLNMSLILGAIVAALIVTGFALGLMDAIWLFTPVSTDFDDKPPMLWAFVVLAFFASWGFWSICLLIFVRGIWADRLLGRLVGLLIAGTALEVLVILPIDIMVRRRTDCYCVTGSFLGLCLASAVALWLAGPGIAIALLARKHRLWRLSHCGSCGYPMGPTPGEVCSECGSAWKREKQAKKGG